MSIRFVNAVMLNTDSNSVIGVGQDKASVAFRLRINGPLPLATTSWNGTALMARSGLAGFGVLVSSVDVAAQTMRVQFLWKAGASGTTTLAATVTLSPSIVYAIAMTYDKDDPNSQALYVNGVKTLMTPSQTTALNSSSSTLQVGNNGGTITARDFSVEDEMWWNGYVLSLGNVFDVMDGAADPSDTGLSATWRGHWTYQGATGGTPTNGDAGLANSIDASWPMKTVVNGAVAGSLLVYGDPMPFVSQAAYDAPIVCSGGGVIRVPTVDPSGNKLQVASYGPSNPTIKINGGSAITLTPALSETHYGATYFLPAGEAIAPGDAVTFSAEVGFLVTNLGAAPACTDLACVNKSQVAIYADVPRTLVGGLNHTSPGNTYYSYYQGPSNWAWRMIVDLTKETTSTVRDDGTLKVNRSGILLATTNFDDQIDNLSYPMPLGKYVLSFIPKDAGRATDVSLSSVTPGCIAELTDYRNNGSAAGDPVVKVYELIETADYPNTLADAGGIDAITTTLTLSNTTNMQPRSASTGLPIMWLKIDDEYMIVETVNTSTKVVTVTRGEFGSTPASHASGASCFSRYYNQNPGLKVNVAGPSGVPDYSDIVLYHEFDCTLPATPSPVTGLDTSMAARLRPTKFIRDAMIDNGIVRHMDSSMGLLQQIVEPEYMRETTDLYHGQDAKFLRDFRVTDLKPFDPIARPYMYLHYPGFPGSETYSATLAYAIDAVQTTFTISDAATAEVMEGSRLFMDSEQMRVTAISGTTVTVVRGCMGTAPAAHASGPITVGWRVPFTSTDQYQGVNQVAVDLTTDVPHRLRTGMWADDPAKIDLNPLAHGTVTLAADAVAGTQTITITAADWTYIKVGLYIQFGTDKPTRIATYDQGTGVCTLDYVVDTDHPAGTVGQTMSGGVWCKSLDGTTHAWSPNQGIVCFYYVTGANRLLVKFYVNLGGAVGVVDGNQTWDQTATIVNNSDTSQVHFKTPVQVYPYEYTAKVSAQNPGCYHWLNLYINASDDAVREAAIRVRDNLPSGVGHKVVVELGNEVWNPAFPFPYLLQGISPIARATTANWIDAWVIRTKTVTQVVKDAFAETGHDAAVLLSLPYQTGAMSVPLARARALGVDVDVVSTAPYYAPAYTPTAAAAFEAADLDQAMDLWLFDYECNATTGTGRLIRDVDNPARVNHETITGRPLKFLTYEGGYKSMLPVPDNGTNDATVYAHGVEKNLDMSYTPNCYLTSLDRLSVDQANGVDGFCFFNLTQPPAKLTEGDGFYHEMWGLTPYHGQAAGRGDGSDGKADNRLTLATPGLPNTKGPLVNLHGTNVSVRLQALLDWNASIAPPVVEHDPLPRRVVVPVRRRRKARPASLHRIPMEHAVAPPVVATRPRRLAAPIHPRRRGVAPSVFRIAVEHVPPPPPTPDAVPVIGRRVIIHRLQIY